MKKLLQLVFFLLTANIIFAQCPYLEGAMVNSCGVAEGTNEFVIFRTASTVSAAVSTYRVNYGTTTPPNNNTLGGSDATTKTGLGNFSGAGCTIVQVTTPATIIPANSRVIFIPAGFDQNYDITGLCGGGTIYIVYIRTNANGGSNSLWNASGTMANNTSGNNRYLNVSYSGSISCNTNNAPVKAYNSSGWPSNIDGNFVSWGSGVTPVYSNNGCGFIILPVTLNSFYVSAENKLANLSWDVSNSGATNKFIIERSEDGLSFTTIGEVNALNNLQQSFNYKDIQPEDKVYYYRLIIVGKNGAKAVSSVVKTGVNAAQNNLMQATPSLATNKIAATWLSSKNEMGTIQVMGAAGNTFLSRNISIIPGNNRQLLDVSALPAGMYFIKLQTPQGQKLARFVKQ
ncbi:MAG: T9SS type A sorting domain-containing protein [Ferruginibacter sp.]